MVCLSRQPLREIANEHQREIQLPREIIGNGDRRSHRLGEKTSIGAKGTELDRKAAALSLPATLRNLLFVLA